MNQIRVNVSSFADAIAAYLAVHPQASDTAEGISRWWLHAELADWPDVRAALQSMVAAGVLVSTRVGDGREYFRLAPSPAPPGAAGSPPAPTAP